MRVGIVIPHIFMQEDILSRAIFAPAQLALGLAEGVEQEGAEVTLFSPGSVNTKVKNITADLSLFEAELRRRGDSYMDLLKKHPLTFISLARQVQSELMSMAMAQANQGNIDILHVYTNEEDIALPFSQFCVKPMVFTHHDPFNFAVAYKSIFPKYAHLNWLSISYAQRSGMPERTNWVGNIYHGLERNAYSFEPNPGDGYIAYLGRIVEPKGVHLAVQAIKQYNATHTAKCTLKIAGKHYSGHYKDGYWNRVIEPELDREDVQYVGFMNDRHEKQDFLGNAKALMVPSTFQEPFGMVMIEALACGTPVIGLNSGAIPEVVTHNETGLVVDHNPDDPNETAQSLADAIDNIEFMQRSACREAFESHFTRERMCREHVAVYQRLTGITEQPDRL